MPTAEPGPDPSPPGGLPERDAFLTVNGHRYPCSAQPERERQLANIALFRLGLQTLAPMGSDRLDFVDVHVGKLAAALTDAFEAGRKAGPS